MNTHSSRRDHDAKSARKRGAVASAASNPTGFGYNNDHYASSFQAGPPHALAGPLFPPMSAITGAPTNTNNGSAFYQYNTSHKSEYEQWLRQYSSNLPVAPAGAGGPSMSSGMNSNSSVRRNSPYLNTYFTPPSSSSSSSSMRVSPHGYHTDNGYGYGHGPYAYDSGPEGPGPVSSMPIPIPPEMIPQMDVDTQHAQWSSSPPPPQAQAAGMTMSPFEFLMYQLHQMKTVQMTQCDTSRLGPMSVGPAGTASGNSNTNGNGDGNGDPETEWNFPRDVSPLILPASVPALLRRVRRD